MSIIISNGQRLVVETGLLFFVGASFMKDFYIYVSKQQIIQVSFNFYN